MCFVTQNANFASVSNESYVCLSENIPLEPSALLHLQMDLYNALAKLEFTVLLHCCFIFSVYTCILQGGISLKLAVFVVLCVSETHVLQYCLNKSAQKWIHILFRYFLCGLQQRSTMKPTLSQHT
eukprot:TRINITY_DN9654_c1_g1_i1.p1 TRINITY_DN9654_c1_g1~~TRINITY_DN9654_c1_g1_i1.p1  ORF type:complete len:125 (+),score=8.79 TRINITY_DN9654_c1_g1_i1:58-432(+)